MIESTEKPHYIQEGNQYVLKVPGIELPEDIFDPTEDGAESRAAHAYAMYVYFQTLKGESVEPYGGRGDKDRVEAYGLYAKQKALEEQEK